MRREEGGDRPPVNTYTSRGEYYYYYRSGGGVLTLGSDGEHGPPAGSTLRSRTLKRGPHIEEFGWLQGAKLLCCKIAHKII